MTAKDDRRNEARAPIELRVEYKRLNKFFFDYTKNICRGGTFINTDRPLPVGTKFLFKLLVPTLNEPLVLQGEVRWIRMPGVDVDPPEDLPSGEGPGMGIQFLYDDDTHRARVDAVVERMIVGSLGAHVYANLRRG